ncbi:MAG: hypothetical protein M3280_00485 [Actinomycetota bacterium]|nr:hypothetical protein [Actinomycetota bacterium]
MGIVESIGLFFQYLLLHAAPPLLVAAAVGAVVGLAVAFIRMGLERIGNGRL